MRDRAAMRPDATGKSRAHARAIVACVLFLLACGEDPVEPTPGPPPALVGADVVANPVNVLSAEVVVTARFSDSATVRYWTGTAAPDSTPAALFGADSVVRIPVVGLVPTAAYQLATVLWAGDTAVVADTSAFTTGSLPDWIPSATAQGSDTTPGFLALSYPDGPVILDNNGTVRWYLSAPDDLLLTFQAHDNGRYTLFRMNDTSAVFHVLDILGREVGTLGCVGRPTRFHDLLWRAEGDYWVLCNDSMVMDLTALGGLDSVLTEWTVVQHVSADGTLLWEWDTRDHFDISDVPPQDLVNRSRVNATHGNSIILDVDGNLLLTFRSLNEATKINSTTGDVIWRFGGLRNQFIFVNDPKGSFERPHGLRLAGPGTLQLLDNGLAPPSRLVRYVVSEETMTARLVVDFRDSPTTYTPVGGGTEFYGNGHAVVSFGRAGRVVEIDPDGDRAWELVDINGVYVFRVQRLRSLYRPARSWPLAGP